MHFAGIEIYTPGGTGERRRDAEDPHSVTNERGRPRLLAILLGGNHRPGRRLCGSNRRLAWRQGRDGVRPNVSRSGGGSAGGLQSPSMHRPVLVTLAPGSLTENNEHSSTEIAV